MVLWEQFMSLIYDGVEEGAALDKLNLKRSCCRTIISSHVELIDKLLAQKEMEKIENAVHETPLNCLNLEPPQSIQSDDDDQELEDSIVGRESIVDW